MRWARGVRKSTALVPTSCPGPLCTQASLVAKSCLTLGDSMVCSLPGLSVHGVIPARILEWLATSSRRGSFQPWGSNPHLLHWQVNSLPLYHLESA